MQIILVTHPGRRPLSLTIKAWQLLVALIVITTLLTAGPLYAAFTAKPQDGIVRRLLDLWADTQTNVVAGKIGEIRARLDSMEAALEVSSQREPDEGLQRQSLRPGAALSSPDGALQGDDTQRALGLLEDRANRLQAAIEIQFIQREGAVRSALRHTLVTPVEGKFSSGFGWRSHPVHGRRAFHRGVDLSAPAGTPVLAVASGVVSFIGPAEAYGKLVAIAHEGGVVSRYAHLEGIEVTTGMAIPAGTRIGRVGSTGRSTGPHLHFELELDGRAVNPWPFLQPGRSSPLLHAAAT